jgi:hypothetical protein
LRTAAFDALYTLNAAVPMLPVVEPVKMIDAPSTSSGKAFCTVNSTPLTLRSNVWS